MRKLISKEVSKLVGGQTSPLPNSLGEGAECSLPLEGGGLGRGWKKYAFTLTEVFSPLCAGSRKIAFTLAEVLITLAIIGVVAAMTMPTLIQNHQKRSLEVATQKFYSMMSQAVKQYMADEGVDDLRNTPLASDNYDDLGSTESLKSIRDFVTKYLKVVKECDLDKNDCFAPKYRGWNGGETGPNDFPYGFSENDRDYVLADGMIIRIRYYGYTEPINLYIDVNGKKGPNRVGYDLWSMSIFYDGSIDESGVGPECKKGIISTHSGSLCVGYGDNPKELRQYRFNECQNGAYGGCFGHFLENGFKFDY